MPFLQQDDEELRKQQEQQGQIAGQSSVINAPQGPQQKPGQPASSGQFKNIQTYLEANKEQGVAQGQKILGTATGAAQQAKTGIESLQAPEETQRQTTESVRQQLQQPSQNVEQYKALKQTGGYTGPQSIQDVQNYSDVQKQTEEASRKIGQIGTLGGVQQLSQEIFQRPDYRTGLQKLDAAFLRQNPNLKQDIASAQSQFGNLTNLLNQASGNIESQIEQNKQAAFDNRQLIPEVEKQYVQDLLGQYNERAAQQNLANEALLDRVSGDISDSTLNKETLDLLGLGVGTNLYDLNLASYLNRDESTLYANDVVSQQERENWQNLMNLIDGTNTDIGESGISVNPASFNIDKLKADLASRAQTYDPILDSIYNKVYGGDSGASQQIGSGNISFQDLLNWGKADEYAAYTPEQVAQLQPRQRQMYDDMMTWLKYNNQIKQELPSFMDNTASGPITGGLKG